MNGQASGIVKIEPIDQNYVRLEIRNGDRITHLTVRVTSDEVAKIIESEQRDAELLRKEAAA